MNLSDYFQRLLRIGDAETEKIAHANDNWQAKPPWMSPAELMQIVRRERRQMRQELISDFSLRHCPKHRHFWESLNGLEAFARWHFFTER